jgi:hypothetical protein
MTVGKVAVCKVIDIAAKLIELRCTISQRRPEE